MALYIDKNIYVGDTGVQLSALGEIANKAPKSHASSGTTYGVGTTSNYGHCRVINNLTTSSATNGYALQAYQGKVLNDTIHTVGTRVLTGIMPIVPDYFSSSTTGDVQVYTNYNFKEQVLAMFPTKTGWTRSYYVVTAVNSSQNNVKLKIGGYQVLSWSIWGAYSQWTARTQFADITTIFNSLSEGHCNIVANNDRNGQNNTWFMIHPVWLYIFDTLN